LVFPSLAVWARHFSWTRHNDGYEGQRAFLRALRRAMTLRAFLPESS